MRINDAGLSLIRKYEGLRLKAYVCPAGVLTIGYGSTGPHVKEGMVITEAEANELLLKDLERFEKCVEALVTKKLGGNAFSACVSFAFNVGLGNFKQSTLLRCINAGNMKDAAAEFLKWNKAAGKVLEGLTRRRKEESALFLS